MDFALIVACLAMALGAVALGRAYVPPQQRKVAELVAAVLELQSGVDDLHARLVKRGAKENMDKARAAHEERKAHRDRIEAEAAAILERQKAAPTQGVMFPADPEAQRRALRASLIVGGKP